MIGRCMPSLDLSQSGADCLFEDAVYPPPSHSGAPGLLGMMPAPTAPSVTPSLARFGLAAHNPS